MSDSADSDFDGLANVVGVGDNAIGGVDLVTSAQRFFPMIYYRTGGNVGGVGDADNGRPFTAALTNVNVSETDGAHPMATPMLQRLT